MSGLSDKLLSLKLPVAPRSKAGKAERARWASSMFWENQQWPLSEGQDRAVIDIESEHEKIHTWMKATAASLPLLRASIKKKLIKEELDSGLFVFGVVGRVLKRMLFRCSMGPFLNNPLCNYVSSLRTRRVFPERFYQQQQRHSFYGILRIEWTKTRSKTHQSRSSWANPTKAAAVLFHHAGWYYSALTLVINGAARHRRFRFRRLSSSSAAKAQRVNKWTQPAENDSLPTFLHDAKLQVGKEEDLKMFRHFVKDPITSFCRLTSRSSSPRSWQMSAGFAKGRRITLTLSTTTAAASAASSRHSTLNAIWREDLNSAKSSGNEG